MSKYVIVVDGGSTGSRIAVYQKLVAGEKVTFQSVSSRDFGITEDSLRVEPGMSKYASHNQFKKAARSLEPLIAKVKLMVEPEAWTDAALYIYATAGVRLLDESTSQSMWRAVSEWASDSAACPFRLVQARTLSGIEEAMFGFFVCKIMEILTAAVGASGTTSFQVHLISAAYLPRSHSCRPYHPSAIAT